MALVVENRKVEEKVITLLIEKKTSLGRIEILKKIPEPITRCYHLKYNNKKDEYKYYISFPAPVFNVIFEFACPVDDPFQY